MFSLLFITILVLVSGVVAWVGDRLGSMIGRRRRSLWGLRPRHTAAVVTVVTGMMITILTLGAILLISKQARVAFFGVEQLSRELLLLNRQVGERNSQLTELRGKLADVSREYAAEEAALRDRLKSTEANLKRKTSEQKELEKAIASLKKDYGAASARLSRAESDVTELTRSKTTLNKEIDRLRTSVVDLRDLARRMAIVRERGYVVFRADQVMQIVEVPEHLNPTKRRAALMALVAGADKMAVRMGAKGAGEAAARVKNMGAAEGVIWSREQFEETLRSLNEADGNTMVTVSSFTNTLPGEPVLLVFHVMPNKLVFKQNEEIARAVIDGRKSHEAIGEDVIKLLRRVREKAVLKGVMPDPEEGMVGSVSAFRILDTIKALRDQGREVNLAVRAAFDTWNSGPLQVDFSIEPIK